MRFKPKSAADMASGFVFSELYTTLPEVVLPENQKSAGYTFSIFSSAHTRIDVGNIGTAFFLALRRKRNMAVGSFYLRLITAL